MSASQLDRIVKGAPPPNVSADQVASAARRASQSSQSSITAPHPPPLDPVSHLPSSPPQIYLNLLILEASLRAQYLSLRARLRLHVLLLGALAIWTLTFTYLLFLRPREDGKGTGGSVYWVIETMEKMAFVGGVVTWCLVWGTGLWDRGMRWPRRWVSVTNRGLRGFNLKVVVIKGSMWKELLGYLSLLGPFGYWAGPKGMRYEYLPRDYERLPPLGSEKDRLKRLDERHTTWIEEDIAPGGDTIKLLLLPKPFSPDFREEWDTYRSAYWEKENERRAVLRRIIHSRDRDLARRQGGWLWWTGWRGWNRLIGGRYWRKHKGMHHTHLQPHVHSQQHLQQLQHQHPNDKSVRDKPSVQQLKRERRLAGSADTNSRSSSRTPTPDPEGRSRRAAAGTDGSRRSSNASARVPGAARKKAPVRPGSRKTAAAAAAGDSSRSATPDSAAVGAGSGGGAGAGGGAGGGGTSVAVKRQSITSVSSASASEGEVKKEETPPIEVEIKEEKQ